MIPNDKHNFLKIKQLVVICLHEHQIMRIVDLISLFQSRKRFFLISNLYGLILEGCEKWAHRNILHNLFAKWCYLHKLKEFLNFIFHRHMIMCWLIFWQLYSLLFNKPVARERLISKHVGTVSNCYGCCGSIRHSSLQTKKRNIFKKWKGNIASVWKISWAFVEGWKAVFL